MEPPGTDQPAEALSRLTVPMCAVLRSLTRSTRVYGLQIAGETDLRPGTIYPILTRLEAARWVTGSWEDKSAPGRQGARRRYYQLTPSGRDMALAALRLRKHLFA